MVPLQFRKLVACRDAGVPVRVLATGDFPTLPSYEEEDHQSGGSTYKLGSRNWQNGVVVLGFFWVKRAEVNTLQVL